jgi:hypothetical protein
MSSRDGASRRGRNIGRRAVAARPDDVVMDLGEDPGFMPGPPARRPGQQQRFKGGKSLKPIARAGEAIDDDFEVDQDRSSRGRQRPKAMGKAKAKSKGTPLDAYLTRPPTSMRPNNNPSRRGGRPGPQDYDGRREAPQGDFHDDLGMPMPDEDDVRGGQFTSRRGPMPSSLAPPAMSAAPRQPHVRRGRGLEADHPDFEVIPSRVSKSDRAPIARRPVAGAAVAGAAADPEPRFLIGDIVQLVAEGVGGVGLEGKVIDMRLADMGHEYRVAMADGHDEACFEDELVLVSDGNAGPVDPIVALPRQPHKEDLLLPVAGVSAALPEKKSMKQRSKRRSISPSPAPRGPRDGQFLSSYADYEAGVGNYCGMDHVDYFDPIAKGAIDEVREVIRALQGRSPPVEAFHYAEDAISKLSGLINTLARLYPLGPFALEEREAMISSLDRIGKELDEAMNSAPIPEQYSDQIGPDGPVPLEADMPVDPRAAGAAGPGDGPRARGAAKTTAAPKGGRSNSNTSRRQRTQSPAGGAHPRSLSSSSASKRPSRAARPTQLQERSASADEREVEAYNAQAPPSVNRRGKRGQGGKQRAGPSSQGQQRPKGPSQGGGGGGKSASNPRQGRAPSMKTVPYVTDSDSDGDFESMSTTLGLTMHVDGKGIVSPEADNARDRHIASKQAALSPIHSSSSSSGMPTCNMPGKNCKLKAVNAQNGRCHLHGGKVLCSSTGPRKCRAVVAPGSKFCVTCAKNGGKAPACAREGCKVAPGKNKFCFHHRGNNADDTSQAESEGTEDAKQQVAVDVSDDDDSDDSSKAPAHAKPAAAKGGIAQWAKSSNNNNNNNHHNHNQNKMKKKSGKKRTSMAPTSGNRVSLASAAKKQKASME